MGQASAFFRQEIKDGYIHELQTRGSLLLGTTRRGDIKAKKVEFPIIGKVNKVRKLTGSLSDVVKQSGDLRTVEVDLDDYETDPDWIFTPDLEKMGVNLKQALKERLAWSVGRSRDMIQWNAMAAFTADGTTNHGTAGELIDYLPFVEAKSAIAGTGGMRPNMIFTGLPAMQFEQLKQYAEFARSEYNGPDLPFTRMAEDKRSWNGIHWIVLPDDYFSGPDGNNLYTYLWQADCVGVENNWGDITTMEQVFTMQGNPWMVKIGYGAAALGILRPGVRRIVFRKQTNLERIPILTKEVA
jgi:hypothetical protein